MRKERGFTLIELLIVLAILGILVGIVAMSVGGLTETAKERGMRSELDIVQTAIDTYNTQNVLVAGGQVIPARAASEEVDVDTGAEPVGDPPAMPAPFVEYLRRSTKYFFMWEEGGADLYVCDVADMVMPGEAAGDGQVAFNAANCFPE